MASVEEPYESPLLAMINEDGSWFCPGCKSLNLTGSKHCYSCRAAFPLAAPKEASQRPAGRSYKLAVVALVALVAVLAMVGSSAIVLVRANAARNSGAPTAVPAVAAVGAQATESPTPSLDPVTPSPTRKATPSPTPTLEPTPTETPARVPSPGLVNDGLVDLPRFPVSVSGTDLSYYAISGSAPAALINGMESGGSKACGLGEALACFYDQYKWTMTGSTNVETEKCTVSSVNLTITYNIILPSWNSPSRVPAALPAWWGKVLDHIVWHESQHLAIARGYAASLKAALLAGPCDTAGSTAAFKAAEAPLDSAQESFDAQQRAENWSYPSYPGPWN
jgi:predicted secreted Zn-dependent protease